MISEVLVYIQGIEGWAVESGEIHIYYQQDINLSFLNLFADVVIIVIKALVVF